MIKLCHGSKPVRGRSTAASGNALLPLVAILLTAAITASCSRGSNSSEDELTFEVKRGPLDISVTEAGTIEAREQIILKNRVEGSTTILFLVPEGQRAKEGDLLVELDASRLQESKIDEEITTQNADSSFIRSRENLAVAKNQAQSDIDTAELAYAFAKQDLEKYVKGEYPNKLRELESQITLKEEDVQRTTDEYKWSEVLLNENYLSASELKADELAMKKAQLDYELAKNNLQLYKDYTYKRQLAQLESDVKQTEMALERTQRKASADIVQAEAEFAARDAELKRQQSKLIKVDEQIGFTKIYAPADGLVVYATSGKGSWRGNAEPLEEGRQVREREELIYLPTAASYKAEVKIHESSLDKLTLGLPVRITVDALPEKRLTGKVVKIALLPDAASRWMNPDLKVYATEIHVDNEDEELKTGMSCRAEILVQQHKDAVYVPIQCVLRVDGKPAVFLPGKKEPEMRHVTLGLDNNRMVHILAGLKGGEHVLLAPPLKNASIEVKNSLSTQEAESAMAERSARSETAPGTERPAVARTEGTTDEQREKMRERMKNMSPEEREKAMQNRRPREPPQ